MENWQIYLMFAVNLIVVIGGVGKGITVLIAVRDEVRDGIAMLKVTVGSVAPPMGLLGDVTGLKRESRSLRDWSIEVSTNLGVKGPGSRS